MKTLIGADYPKQVIPLIDEAKHSIDVVTYDWRWYANKPAHATQQFNMALVRATRRGVKVRAVVNVAKQAVLLKNFGIDARTLRDKRLLHAKLLIVDRTKVIIGSHNLTSNAFYRNLECSVVADIPENDNRLLRFFENLYVI